jgi:exodeoxyribonuclease V alpha subunit
MVATEPPPPVWQQRPRTQARPLVLQGTRLYLDRYAQLEHLVRTVLTQRARREPPQVDPRHLQAALATLDGVPATTGPTPHLPAATRPSPDQRVAVAAAATGWVTVIAGGPGTGKTWTIDALLQTLQHLADADGAPAPRVALAAPTGKASARMQEQTGGRHEAMTIHRLLGPQPWRGLRFRHDWQNRLPYDVVVVDETSMVSLELMARLLEALPTTCRLVLVGDPDQLASVDAGAVLADLVERPPRPAPDARERLLDDVVGHHLTAYPLAAEHTMRGELRRDLVRLRHNRRAERAIATLAEAIRRGDADVVLDALRAPATPEEGEVEWVPLDAATAGRASLEALREDVARAGAAMVDAARRGDAAEALRQLGRHRLLCAHRSGPYGVTRWRDLAAGWVAARTGTGWLGDEQTFPVGRPLLVTENDRMLGLWNGDTGVVVGTEDGVTAVFDRGGGRPLHVPVSRLPAVQTSLALTVHKAQGGEADHVSVVLPPPDSPLLTRELLYTGVTRARHLVRVVGTEESVRAAVARRVVRASGLREGWPGLGPAGPAGSEAGAPSPDRPAP